MIGEGSQLVWNCFREMLEDEEISVGNFKFLPKIFWGEQIGQPRARCGPRCHRSVHEFPYLFCYVPSTGSFSQFCLILHPRRVAVPFPPAFASPWRNSFVQIYSRTTLLLASPATTTHERPKLGVRIILRYSNSPLENHWLPMNV